MPQQMPQKDPFLDTPIASDIIVAPKPQKSKLQSWLLKKAVSPWGPHILAISSFAESSISPIPPDILLIPMIIANRSKAFVLAAICTISSVLGGILGYILGYYLIDTIGQMVIQSYGLEAEFINFQRAFNDYGFWLIIFKGVTPIPFKLVTIASGATQLNFGLFVIAATISRSIRFFMIATALWHLGDEAKSLYEKHFKLVMIGSIGAVVFGYILLKCL